MWILKCSDNPKQVSIEQMWNDTKTNRFLGCCTTQSRNTGAFNKIFPGLSSGDSDSVYLEEASRSVLKTKKWKSNSVQLRLKITA